MLFIPPVVVLDDDGRRSHLVLLRNATLAPLVRLLNALGRFVQHAILTICGASLKKVKLMSRVIKMLLTGQFEVIKVLFERVCACLQEPDKDLRRWRRIREHDGSILWD